MAIRATGAPSIRPGTLRPLSVVPSSRDKARKIARHELGHLIAAKAFGFKTGDCTVKLSFNGNPIDLGHEGGASIILIEPLPSSEDLERYLRRRIKVLFAGVLAESLKDDGTVDDDYACRELETGGGMQDYKVISELRWILRNLKHPIESSEEEARNQAESLQGELWHDSILFVQKHRELICGFADKLAFRLTHFEQVATLTSEEIESAPVMKAFMKECASHGLEAYRNRAETH